MSTAACPGDCDGNGEVAVDELIVGVAIALTTQPLAACPAFDLNADESVDVVELVTAVNVALGECPLPSETFTPTPTATPTPSTTPTAEPVPTWTQAFDTTGVGWMMSAWGPGDGRLWAVGGTIERGRIFQFSMGEWTAVDPGFSVPLLNWVHGTSATDLFVGSNDGRVLHFDGTVWTAQVTPVSVPVWGVFAIAHNDVWAVGGDVSSNDPAFVMHYDGRAWIRSTLPTLVRPRVNAFFKVWASGPNDVFFVGQNGAVVHYDGQDFVEQFVGSSQDLIGIWGTGPDNVMIVGGRGTAELVHFDGATWTHESSFLPGLNGVWMRRPDVAHAVGIAGTVLRVTPQTLEAVEELPNPTRLDLHSVFGDPGGQLFALGANFITPERGVALMRRLTNDD